MNKLKIRILTLTEKKRSISLFKAEPDIWRLSSWETVENIINCWTNEFYSLKVIYL